MRRELAYQVVRKVLAFQPEDAAPERPWGRREKRWSKARPRARSSIGKRKQESEDLLERAFL